MKIRALRATPVNIPFVAPYRFSYGSIASLTKAIVEVETEDGVVGLGGAVREKIALTECFSYRLPGPKHPGESTPVEVARTCAGLDEAYGSTIFDGKVATVAMAKEVILLREIRAAIGERELTLDANGGDTVPTAREALRRFAPFRPFWFEVPLFRSAQGWG